MAVHNFDKLQVMTWNANSVSPKKHELFDFLLTVLTSHYLTKPISNRVSLFQIQTTDVTDLTGLTVLRVALVSWFAKILE
jgi:hypothetical protein